MSKHHQVVTHYMTEHGYIPLWVLVNVLTFGKIENFSVLGIVRAKDGSYTYGTNDAYFKNSYIPFQPQISCP